MNTCTEPRSISLVDGRLAALVWGRDDAPTWLALHGWLDNAATFSRLAPLLVKQLDIRIVAIDFAGHGQSEWLPPRVDYALWDYIHDVLDALDALKLERATLLAHSLGAIVASVMAGTIPERIERLWLIDGLAGLLTTSTEHTVVQLRNGILGARRRPSTPPRYERLEDAINARVAGAVTPLDYDTAAPLVVRNLEEHAGSFRFRTDPRLLRPSLVRFTPEQVDVILAAIEAPVGLIEAEQGILGNRPHGVKARAQVRHLARHVLPGGHHLHLERGHVARVVDVIVSAYAGSA
ncbi:alpha/beta fold hydrolase [Phytohalomonas tamaricis]|uniref:alpha/beta fold hydrolase n=1 Tax=Phytohalomonas tamaricis TaxID=2081032 RepID=UPI000D0B3C41|nr:alpha/beta hydrolase [Phytohalomonas tamaricis]